MTDLAEAVKWARSLMRLYAVDLDRPQDAERLRILADAAEASAWRPIESAPRDGTWFLACATTPGWEATRRVRFDEPDDRLPISGENVLWPSAPTHWMPLPKEPPR